MNTLLALALSIAIVSPAVSPADLQMDAVVTALSQGNAAAVGSHFDKTVELVLPGVEDILPKASAEAKLKAFFGSHAAKSFARVHGGTSNGANGTYVIGTLTCADGDYRVYIYGRGPNSSTIQELRIEEE